MDTLFLQSKQNESVTTFEETPDEIQLMIFKYLSLYDLYKTFFNMNLRFNRLVNHITPENYNMVTLNEDIRTLERHTEWRFRGFIWWEELVYYLIPRRGCHALRWAFVSQVTIEQLGEESRNSLRILSIISKYPVSLNTLFLIFDVRAIKKMYFRSKEFPQWMKEHYNEQHKIIIDSESRWYTEEVCNAFREINKMEKNRQEQMIHEQAKKIWWEIRKSQDFLVSSLPACPEYRAHS
ncbi:unnamed protein product [Adineta ricciae]|uniref:F-box domain-containing protein n=1 Tax=Adineta ricciae TaxID=249248 RepID=A0A815C5N4_ADIRI|nr:unnamed protein product [Adineta ricciae]CAF1276043.1 unnamed protein product [Adineta ricciae]